MKVTIVVLRVIHLTASERKKKNTLFVIPKYESLSMVMSAQSHSFGVGTSHQTSFNQTEWPSVRVDVREHEPKLNLNPASLNGAAAVPNLSPTACNIFGIPTGIHPSTVPNLSQASLVPGSASGTMTVGLGIPSTLDASTSGISTRSNSNETNKTNFMVAKAEKSPTMSLNSATMQLPVAQEAQPLKTVEQEQNLSTPIQSPEVLLPTIGAAIDELVHIASDARKHFHEGQFDESSKKIDTLRNVVKQIDDVGTTSMDLVNDVKLRSRNCSQTTFSSVYTPEHEQQLYAAAAFSPSRYSEVRKRRNNSDIAPAIPLKSFRAASVATRGRSHSDLTNFVPPLVTPTRVNSSLLSPPLPTGNFEFKVSEGPTFHPTPLQSSHSPMDPHDSKTGTPSLGISHPNDKTILPLSDASTAAILGTHTSVVNSPVQGSLNSSAQNEGQGTMALGQRPNTSLNEPMQSMQALNMALESHTGSKWSDDTTNILQPSIQVAMGQQQQDQVVLDQPHTSNLDPAADDLWDNYGSTDRGALNTDLPADLRAHYDKNFHEFLTCICSNVEAKDDRGELIHQVFMPKKMARLDESPDFRPFKFRIQPFSNAFQSELQRRGLSEDDCSMRKVKPYLWSHPYISRFNEDGRKSKSKGNHIWNVEARRLPNGGWEFFTFMPKIAAPSSKIAYVGEPWTWNLRIWDPQSSASDFKVAYSATKLPSWLKWEDNDKVLSGTPSSPLDSGDVSIMAVYVHLGQLHRLEQSFLLRVVDRSDPNVASQEASSASVPEMVSPPLPAQTTSATSPLVDIQVTPLPQTDRHEVVDPSRASDVLASLNFPFTPPVYMEGSHVQPQFGLDAQMMQNRAIMEQPNAVFSESSQQVPSFVDKTATLQPVLPQAGPSGHISPPLADIQSTSHSTPLASPGMVPGSTNTVTPMMQMWNVIDQRQREQASSFMLLMPQRPQSFSLSEHPGQGTPMSNLPNDMGATLPQISKP